MNTVRAPNLAFPSRRPAACAALALLLAVGAVGAVRAESFLESLARKAEEARKKLEESTTKRAPAAPPAPPALMPPAPAPADAAIAPRGARSVDVLRALMSRGTVPGDELVLEVRGIRTAVREQRSAASIVDLKSALQEPAAPNAPKADWKTWLSGGADKVLENALKESVGRVAYHALDDFLGTLTDDPTALRSESIKFASPVGMSDAQVRRVVTMGALVVAAKATKHVLDQAKKDFAGVEDEYKSLIDRREKAAALLYEVVGARAQAQRDGDAAALREADAKLGGTLSADDMAFLEADLSRLGAAQFANDIAAQNLAIKFLRQRDPKAFEDYAAQREGTLKRTKGYLRTAAGAAAVGALSAAFVREVGKARKDASTKEIVALLPFGAEFVASAMPLMVLAADAGGTAITSTVKSLQRFRIVSAGGEERVSDAGAAFAAIKARQADHLFAESLFRTGSPGLLQRVHVCDGAEAGRMFDTAIPVKEREQFAQSWFGSNVPSDGFAFVNALAGQDGASERERELGDRLLRADYRGQRDETTTALGQLQERLGQRYTRWGSDQLMRLIFANREGAAALATLQLGDVSVRPIPSMESIYIYESLIDSCKSLLSPPKPQAAAAGTGANKPRPAPAPPAPKRGASAPR